MDISSDSGDAYIAPPEDADNESEELDQEVLDTSDEEKLVRGKKKRMEKKKKKGSLRREVNVAVRESESNIIFPRDTGKRKLSDNTRVLSFIFSQPMIMFSFF